MAHRVQVAAPQGKWQIGANTAMSGRRCAFPPQASRSLVETTNAGTGKAVPAAGYIPPRARLANFVRWLRKARRTVPVAPLRCLEMMSSAMPRSSESSL